MVALTVITAVVGAAISFKAASDQADAQKDFARAQNTANEKLIANSKKQAELQQANLRRENDRKRRANVREFLRQRGQTLAGAANRGALGSSGVAGATAGLSSQVASNFASINKGEQVAINLGTLEGEAADIRGVANQARTAFDVASAENNALSSFGDTLFSNAKQIGSVGGSLFGEKTA